MDPKRITTAQITERDAAGLRAEAEEMAFFFNHLF